MPQQPPVQQEPAQQEPAQQPRVILPPPLPEPAAAVPAQTSAVPAQAEEEQPSAAQQPEEPKALAAVPSGAPQPTIFERASPAADAAAIRNLLDRWVTAVKYGDAESAARCYAQRLTSYLGRTGATQSDVRGHIVFLHGRDGKLAINRIADLGIAPDGRDLATVRFRRHWETAGPPRTSGEAKQQMTLVRTSGGWKIAAEQETRVY
jgi:hypothetical protein